MIEDNKAYDIESAISATVEHIGNTDGATQNAMYEHLTRLMELQLNYLSQVLIEVSGEPHVTIPEMN